MLDAFAGQWREGLVGALEKRSVVCRVSGLVKSYPPATAALRGVDLTLCGGEIHGLLGVNGAGKSTLIKILSGVEQPDAGSLWVEGIGPVRFATPSAAHVAGIGAVHQELPLLGNLTAADNVALGMQRGFFGPARRREMGQRYQTVASRLGAAPAANRRLSEVGIDRWQVVAIVRALTAGARILVLDEPTSSLDGGQRQSLHEILKELAATGLAILYVSHFLDDILDACGTVTVLRDGRVSLSAAVAGLSSSKLLSAMIGDERLQPTGPDGRGRSSPVVSASSAHLGDPTLRIRGLRTQAVQGVDLDLWPGERVGLYGRQGCGATELLEAIFGLRPCKGEVRWRGRNLTGGVRQRIDVGVGYLPPERRKGLILSWTVAMNCGLPGLGALFPLQTLNVRQETDSASSLINKLGITGEPNQLARTLSGGNQQKVSLGKWLMSGTTCLLANQPTRGVDVSGRRLIQDIIVSFAAAGNVLLLYSTDPEEVVDICSRVVVLDRGLVVEEIVSPDISIQRLEALTTAWTRKSGGEG
jgi:ABC-type sugar transport system ATPase subunit